MTVYLNLVDTKIHTAWVVLPHSRADTLGIFILLNRCIWENHFTVIVYSQWSWAIAVCCTAFSSKSETRRVGETVYVKDQRGYDLCWRRRRIWSFIDITGKWQIFLQWEVVVSLKQANNSRQLGILDATVFAYTWTILDKLGEGNLLSIINKYENLIRHAISLNSLLYSWLLIMWRIGWMS